MVNEICNRRIGKSCGAEDISSGAKPEVFTGMKIQAVRLLCRHVV
jgi:hypothetical protein